MVINKEYRSELIRWLDSEIDRCEKELKSDDQQKLLALRLIVENL